jgi:hypothetical protein
MNLDSELMIDDLVATLTARFGVGDGMARQALAMVMKGLNTGGESELAAELTTRISGLAELAVGGGGLMGGLAGMMGGGKSPIASLAGMIGQQKMVEVIAVVSEFVGDRTDEVLAERTQAALLRLSR